MLDKVQKVFAEEACKRISLYSTDLADRAQVSFSDETIVLNQLEDYKINDYCILCDAKNVKAIELEVGGKWIKGNDNVAKGKYKGRGVSGVEFKITDKISKIKFIPMVDVCDDVVLKVKVVMCDKNIFDEKMLKELRNKRLEQMKPQRHHISGLPYTSVSFIPCDGCDHTEVKFFRDSECCLETVVVDNSKGQVTFGPSACFAKIVRITQYDKNNKVLVSVEDDNRGNGVDRFVILNK